MLSLAHFVRSLVASGELTHDQLAPILNSVPQDAPDGDLDALQISYLAHELVQRNYLTAWQCSVLRRGGNLNWAWQGRYRFVDHGPGGKHYDQYTVVSVETRETFDLILQKVNAYYSAVVIRKDQLLSALRVWAPQYLRYVETKYRIIHGYSVGVDDCRTCLAEDLQTNEIVQLMFLPAGDYMNVVIARPLQIVEVGIHKPECVENLWNEWRTERAPTPSME